MDEATNPFAEIAAYAKRSGVRDLKSRDGCWEVAVDATWWFAVNGHGTPTRCSRGTEVPPYHAYIECNEMPAGLLHPTEGGAFIGTTDNLTDRFVAALRAAGRTPA